MRRHQDRDRKNKHGGDGFWDKFDALSRSRSRRIAIADAEQRKWAQLWDTYIPAQHRNPHRPPTPPEEPEPHGSRDTFVPYPNSEVCHECGCSINPHLDEGICTMCRQGIPPHEP